jgi:crossover junction endodeoxyribonuclease RusA
MTAIRTAEIFLPWPDKRLSPNARGHWATLARAKKSARAVAYHNTREAGIGKINAESIAVQISFFPPDRRSYDDDGLLSRMKAALDGISDAIGVDDSKFRIGGAVRGPVEKNGMVKVQLEWAAKEVAA